MTRPSDCDFHHLITLRENTGITNLSVRLSAISTAAPARHTDIEIARGVLAPSFALDHPPLVLESLTSLDHQLVDVCLFPDILSQRLVCDDIDDVDPGFLARNLQFVSIAHLQDYVDACGESGCRPPEAFHTTSILLCRHYPPTMQATSLQPLAPLPRAELSPSVHLWMSSVSALHGVLDVFVWARVLFTRTVLGPNGFNITLKIMIGYRCTCTRKTERKDQTFDV